LFVIVCRCKIIYEIWIEFLYWFDPLKYFCYPFLFFDVFVNKNLYFVKSPKGDCLLCNLFVLNYCDLDLIFESCKRPKRRRQSPFGLVISDFSMITMESELPVCRFCMTEDYPWAMVSPCACQGSSAFVHHECLDHWYRISNNKVSLLIFSSSHMYWFIRNVLIFRTWKV
jgi:hypothetical protein